MSNKSDDEFDKLITKLFDQFCTGDFEKDFTQCMKKYPETGPLFLMLLRFMSEQIQRQNAEASAHKFMHALVEKAMHDAEGKKDH